MRVSEYFNLNRHQSELDFVDVDVEKDIPAYVDPGCIRWLSGSWGTDCTFMLTTFMDSVLDAVKREERDRTFRLLKHLREPNETHLGLSQGKSAGRALGLELIEQLTSNLLNSKAAKTGLIEDLEDTSFFIPGIGSDIISDITTNIIRGTLITYTQSAAHFYGIPLSDVPSGPVWDPYKKEWEEGITSLPIAIDGRILLIPKIIVRRDQHLSSDEYYRHHLLTTLQKEELDSPSSNLVRILKDGSRVVRKKDLGERFKNNKTTITDFSLDHRNVFRTYKEIKKKSHPIPLSHEKFGAVTGNPAPDFDSLLEEVVDTPNGTNDANLYHSRVEALLSALFYPELSMPEKEREILEGRKRIDICYTNTSSSNGFFWWLRSIRVPCQYIFVECKNYSRDLNNPELDQISSRFSQLRGRVGILTCRSFDNKEAFIKRCRDTAQDGRGYVLLLDDADLRDMVSDMKRALTPPKEREEMDGDWPNPYDFPKLKKAYDQLVL